MKINPPLPLVLWHASRTQIDRPTISGRTEGDNHANSGLGIFCATAPHDYIKGFGGFIHELTLKDDARVLRMPLGDLIQMCRNQDRDRKWFEAEGRRLSEKYDVIELVEITGIAEQAIVLIDSAVASSRYMTNDEFDLCSSQHGSPRSNLKTIKPGR